MEPVKEKSAKIQIGAKSYLIRSDDTYLRQMRSGMKNRVQNFFRGMAGGNQFEPRMVKLFETLVTKDSCVLDIGANIGCTAVLFGDISKQVVAFEPGRSTFHYLEKNVSASGH